jgi:hypothetical protein
VKEIPKVGLEPTPPCGDRILSPARLPFRHFGNQTDYLLMRLKQGLLQIPPGMDIIAFLEFDGKVRRASAA